MNAAAKTIPATIRFVDNNDGTITDTRTGLMWSQVTNTSKEVNHKKAGEVCKALDLAGHNDWRLPTVEELSAIVDYSKHAPAIDSEAFPDTQSDWYWTSTLCAWSSGFAWVVSFDYGSVSHFHRGGGSCFVRAVRSSQ